MRGVKEEMFVFFTTCLILYMCIDSQVHANIDECISTPCLNNGTCIDGDDAYSCDCPEFFSGSNCASEWEAKQQPADTKKPLGFISMITGGAVAGVLCLVVLAAAVKWRLDDASHAKQNDRSQLTSVTSQSPGATIPTSERPRVTIQTSESPRPSSPSSGKPRASSPSSSKPRASSPSSNKPRASGAKKKGK